jgi:hypothetical protein
METIVPKPVSTKTANPAVEKVKAVFERYLNPIDGRHDYGKKGVLVPKRVVFCNAYELGVLILFSDGHWTCVGSRAPRDLCGGIDGWNYHVSILADELPRLKVITKKEAQEFKAWYQKQSDKQHRRSNLNKVRAEAACLGYALVKDLTKARAEIEDEE